MEKGIGKLLDKAKNGLHGLKFTELEKICRYYFGAPRQNRGSHQIYTTPWQGDPRINIQNNNGKAKFYQVKQVLQAIEKLERD